MDFLGMFTDSPLFAAYFYSQWVCSSTPCDLPGLPLLLSLKNLKRE